MASAVKPPDPTLTGPALRLERFFAGSTFGWGVFEDRFGRLRRRFTVHALGCWADGKLALTERFRFDDGRETRKQWQIVPEGENFYRGTADGVAGAAVGRVVGNSFRWAYIYDLEIGTRTWRVRFEDRYYLQGDEVLINRSLVTKFGLRIGEATAVFEKRPPGEADPER